MKKYFKYSSHANSNFRINMLEDIYTDNKSYAEAVKKREKTLSKLIDVNETNLIEDAGDNND